MVVPFARYLSSPTKIMMVRKPTGLKNGGNPRTSRVTTNWLILVVNVAKDTI